MLNDLFTDTMKLMEYSLGLRARQNEFIASNLANYETPGYKPVRVDFETSMMRALKEVRNDKNRDADNDTHPITRTNPINTVMSVLREGGQNGSLDENAVSIEREIAQLEENTLLYSITAQLLAQRFRGIKTILENESRV